MSLFLRISLAIIAIAALAACSGKSDQASDSGNAPATTARVAETPAEAAMSKALRDNGCAACHSVKDKRTGPSMQDLQGRYTVADRDALIDALKNGSRKRWGNGMMPAQKQLTDAQAGEIIDLILAQQ